VIAVVVVVVVLLIVCLEFLGFECMFHVNSLLEDDGSEQQLSRKRFIGNDLVVFVFVEGDQPWDPNMITSQMCHTFIVVRKVGSGEGVSTILIVAAMLISVTQIQHDIESQVFKSCFVQDDFSHFNMSTLCCSGC
jgi:hypothetical protein